MEKQHALLPLFLVLVLLLLSIHTTKACRPLKQEICELQKHEIALENLTEKIAGEAAANLMGLEECDGADEACMKRRMMSEAHLDYIYTQHHKP